MQLCLKHYCTLRTRQKHWYKCATGLALMYLQHCVSVTKTKQFLTLNLIDPFICVNNHVCPRLICLFQLCDLWDPSNHYHHLLTVVLVWHAPPVSLEKGQAQVLALHLKPWLRSGKYETTCCFSDHEPLKSFLIKSLGVCFKFDTLGFLYSSIRSTTFFYFIRSVTDVRFLHVLTVHIFLLEKPNVFTINILFSPWKIDKSSK